VRQRWMRRIGTGTLDRAADARVPNGRAAEGGANVHDGFGDARARDSGPHLRAMGVYMGGSSMHDRVRDARVPNADVGDRARDACVRGL
jgi:hypothetical protein